MSSWAFPMIAANSAVSAPTTATVVIAAGACRYRGAIRQVTYTPAVTIVAAWIRADTGVGPAIASGSQTYNGIWALFPQAPMNSSNPIPAAAAGVIRPTSPITEAKLNVPKEANIQAIARMNAMSPI